MNIQMVEPFINIKMVKPHRLLSRPVTIADKDRVTETASAMRKWMNERACVGLAHPQADDSDPLAFFIVKAEPHVIFLNPKIVSHSPMTIKSLEGCMSYPGREHEYHDRYKSITVEYDVFFNGGFAKKRKILMGFPAVVYQHEIDHLNGIYCYDN